MTLKLKRYKNASDYLAENENMLLKEEALNSLLLGLCISRKNVATDETVYLDIREQNDIQFTGIKTPNRFLIVNGNESRLPELLPILIKFLNHNKISLPGIVGPAELVLTLCQQLTEKHSWNYKIRFKQLIYQLTHVKYSPNIDGKLTKAKSDQIDKIAKWMNDFSKEALQEDDSKQAYRVAEKKITNGEVYLWQKDTAVSMASTARPTINGITVNYVFTPPRFRGKGYGTKVVAALSTHLLNQGYKFCTLFTDMDYPTSNKIYTKIGYEPKGEFRSIAFE